MSAQYHTLVIVYDFTDVMWKYFDFFLIRVQLFSYTSYSDRLICMKSKCILKLKIVGRILFYNNFNHPSELFVCLKMLSKFTIATWIKLYIDSVVIQCVKEYLKFPFWIRILSFDCGWRGEFLKRGNFDLWTCVKWNFTPLISNWKRFKDDRWLILT